MSERSGYKVDAENSKGETCWSCGHWLIGGGCWKYGQMHQEGWINSGPNDSCEEWLPEGTEGTITHEIAISAAQIKESESSE
ncbi:hypothetical protein [Paenibacillus camelliae]|uniref:hypothetical protein n=1 Tax=Paenibacillus camelliae TaxID=512410 RepID=UPI00203AD17E|nr:hypothetical protein [Paenibacillus camelliae]MCM3632886.1 hypothetical protein [Paenibacillus camelliae]